MVRGEREDYFPFITLPWAIYFALLALRVQTLIALSPMWDFLIRFLCLLTMQRSCCGTRSAGYILNNIPGSLANPTQLKEAVDHARPALTGRVHPLLDQVMMQGFAFVAQWVIFGGNDMSFRQAIKIVPPQWAGFRMLALGMKKIHVVTAE